MSTTPSSPAEETRSLREEWDALDRAAARVDYQLTYARAKKPRQFHSYGISGDPLPNAYYGREGYARPNQPEVGSGEWDDPDHPTTTDEQKHIDRWFTSAIAEAVHEALEWFWVDGEIYLDPHGPASVAISDLSTEFAEKLLLLKYEIQRLDEMREADNQDEHL